MEGQLEKSVIKLPFNLQADAFRLINVLQKQEDDTVIGLIEDARHFLRLSREEIRGQNGEGGRRMNSGKCDTLPKSGHFEFDDFKEERDEVMLRMSLEQTNLEKDKERQTVLLKEKMELRASKQMQSVRQADMLVREADKMDELHQTKKNRQEQLLKEKLEEMKNKKQVTGDEESPINDAKSDNKNQNLSRQLSTNQQKPERDNRPSHSGGSDEKMESGGGKAESGGVISPLVKDRATPIIIDVRPQLN